jgi:glucose/arabinose dehydrogenase
VRSLNKGKPEWNESMHDCRTKITVAAIVLLTIPASACFSDEPQQTADVTSVRLVPVFAETRFEDPVDVDALPGAPGSYLVTEKEGKVKLANDSGHVETLVDLTDEVDATGAEQGLLSLIPTLDFTTSREVLVYYSALSGNRRVARLSVVQLRNGDVSHDRRVVLEIPHRSRLHWGGGMAFGDRGYLYLGIGDGEWSDRRRPNHNAQNLRNLLGTILRIAPSETGYSIPEDNPFVGNSQGHREEIWAYGFRNPWRLSIDQTTGEMWVADVGHMRWEEINRGIGPGMNYGWDIVEGFDCVRESGCRLEGLTSPLAVYSHDEGCAVVGGVAYRGRGLQLEAGRFVFGDYCSGRIWSIGPNDSAPTTLLETGKLLYGLAVDEAGEILVLAADGIVYRLESQEEE